MIFLKGNYQNKIVPRNKGYQFFWICFSYTKQYAKNKESFDLPVDRQQGIL